jgi:endoglucanase
MKTQRLLSTLRTLVELPGVPGHEGPVRAYVKQELMKCGVHSMFVDRVGNLVGKREGSDPSAPSLLLDAHLDEPGFIVRYIDPQGYLYLGQVGYVTDLVLPGQRFAVHTRSGPVKAVSGVKSFHLTTPEERTQPLSWENIWLDVGTKNREETRKMGIRIGDPIVFDRDLAELANNLVTGKALDNRIGCAVLLEVVRELTERQIHSTIYVSATVQEEEVCRGARVIFEDLKAALGATPDFAIVYDITLAGDFPEVKPHISSINVGEGPTIKVFDRSRANPSLGIIVSPQVVDLLTAVAEENRIPYQYEVQRVATNSDIFHVEATGVLTAGISIPCRYTHSPTEVVSLVDAANAVKLSVTTIEKLPQVFEDLLPT